MRTTLLTATAAFLVWSVASLALAEKPKPVKGPLPHPAGKTDGLIRDPSLVCGQPGPWGVLGPGRGAGQGAGFGPGGGYRAGWGLGSGRGRGPGFLDANRDGAGDQAQRGAGDRRRGCGCCCSRSGVDPALRTDHEVFHYLLSHHDDIRRQVKQLPNGVQTLTESDDPALARQIQVHAEAMHRRVQEGNPLHLRDPLFAAIFGHARRIVMKVEKTPRGVQVTEVSEDPFVVKLIQAHARVVSQFVANGHPEMRRNHEVPRRTPSPPQHSKQE